MLDAGLAARPPKPGLLLSKVLLALARGAGIASLLGSSTPAAAQGAMPQQMQPRIIVQNGHASPISAAAWTADGKALLTGSTDGQVLIWDLAGRIVNRITLGSRGRRTVVEEIAATADGNSFAVTEIEFRDMFDNGVGSEVHRRRYRIGVGDERSEASEETQIDPPWSEGVSFYVGSIGHKNALFARSDKAVSKQGWTLVKADGQLAMRPPGPASSPVPLRGALGFASDQGDVQMEAHARKLDLGEQGRLRFAAVLEEIRRNCELQEAENARRRRQANSAPVAPNRLTGDATRVHVAEEPCQARGGDGSDIDLGALGDGDTSVSQRPQISPDGKRLAWIDPANSSGPWWKLHILDLDQGTTRSARFDAPIASARFAWTGATALLARTAAGDFAVDGESAAVRAVPAAACLPVAADELARTEAPDLSGVRTSEWCATGPPASDARLVRLSAVDGIVHVADAVSGRHVCTAFMDQSEIYPAALTLASNDKRWILLQSGLGYTELFTVTERALQSAAGCTGTDCAAVPSDSQLRQRKCFAPAAFTAEPGRVGFHPTLPLLWSEGRGGRIDFYLTANIRSGSRSEGLGAPLFTLFRLPDARFFAIDRDGRYDTNLPPDTSAVRWSMSDAPLQSLAPQTFMRDYYQPGLMRRLLECSGSPGQDCASRFPPVRALASLNRVLPDVKIIAVKPGAEPNRVEVEIEVRGGSMLDAPNGRTTTEPFNLRLFRDGALVAQYPKLGVDEDLSDIAAWRARNLVPLGADGTRRISLPLDLPTGKEDRTIALTAYAFNEDRVKSETARAEYTQPAVAKPRKRRAFVVTFGIDAYDKTSLNLQFAASDARLLGDRLARIPGYEVRRATFAGDTAGAKPARVTAVAIGHTIAILRGVKVAEAKQALRDMGFDASQLEPPTPDDIVILAFSGHGWADKNGAFYLVPADAKWPASGEPDRRTLISAVQMADRLREVDAGEMAMIIDACHSAASVDGGGFKPGPMGDAGLGQLAFDKGIRILAATQADDVAYEDSTLRQGLLTYVLANEGITDAGGKADSNGDHRITLDEWLGYAVARMPALGEEIHLGRTTIDASGTRARGWIPANPVTSRPRIQEPALFNFNPKPSGVVLRDGVRP